MFANWQNQRRVLPIMLTFSLHLSSAVVQLSIIFKNHRPRLIELKLKPRFVTFRTTIEPRTERKHEQTCTKAQSRNHLRVISESIFRAHFVGTPNAQGEA